MNYEAFVEFKPWLGEATLYLVKRTERTRQYLTCTPEGMVQVNSAEEGTEVKPFLILPIDVFTALSIGLSDHLEKEGGKPGVQFVKGEAKRMLDEIDWLRKQIEK